MLISNLLLLFSLLLFYFLELHGIAGAAFEHKTLLGRILRMSPDPSHDPKMRELLSESHRQPRNIVEGNITNLR